MTEKQIEQHLKLLEQQLTLSVWFEKEFREKLGNEGYQQFIDQVLDEMNRLKNLKKKKSDE